MSAAATCQQCGTPVTGGALFCSKCGADVTTVHASVAETLAATAVGKPVRRFQSTMRQMLRDATLGEYEILSELGRGGMATVFLAHDISLDRKVAIKVMAPHLLEGEGMAERFKLEARTAAQLSHPHIIPIYAVKETEASLFFIMKFVEGKPLDDVIKKLGQLPIPMVKDILTKVGSALGYAHRRGVVHRDVKPANVMIDEEGTPIVTDFGIAKVAEAKGLTVTGTTIGTPTYMSPEQCEAKEVTGASDQYSLGVVAWEMLTGSAPFSGDSAVTTMYKHCHEPLPPLQDFRPDCPGEVLEAVTRMLAKAPSDRWPSLEAAIRKLGSTTQDQLDPIRRELLELAKDTDARELIAQLSTPRSPIPGVTTGGRTGGRVGGRTGVAEQAGEFAEERAARRSRLGIIAAGVVVLAAGGTLAALRPWEAPAAPASADGGALVPAAGGETSGDVVAGGGAPGGAQSSGGQPSDPPAGGGTQSAGGGGAGGPGTPEGSSQGSQPGGGGSSAGGGAANPPAGGGTAGGSTGGGRGAAQPPAQPRVTSVSVSSPQGALEPGDRATLTASLRAGSSTVSDRAPTWSSSPASVGSVDASGVFTAAAPGTATVTASIDGVGGSTTITVGAPSVADLSVTPTNVTLVQGERTRLSAQASARGGAPLDATVGWRSDATGVATVTSGGEVQAVGPGNATITVSAGGVTRQIGVTVMPPPVDTRAAVEGLVAAYARALEGDDIAALRRAYPGMTTQQEQNFRESLPNIERATLRIASLDEQGDAATATIQGTYGFLINQRRSTSDVSFVATFRRVASGWEMSRIQ